MMHGTMNLKLYIHIINGIHTLRNLIEKVLENLYGITVFQGMNLEITNISCLASTHMAAVTHCNHSLSVSPLSLPLARPAGQPVTHSLTRWLSLFVTLTATRSTSPPATQSLTATRSTSPRTHSVTHCYSLGHSLIRWLPIFVTLSLPLAQPANHSVTHCYSLGHSHTHSMSVTLSHCHSLSQLIIQSLTATRSVTHSLTRWLSLIVTRSVFYLGFFTKLFQIAYGLFKPPFCTRKAVVPFSARPTVTVPYRGFSQWLPVSL